MKSLSKEDYLRLIESVQTDDEGYEDLDNYEYSDAWIPAESPNKEKMLRAQASSAHGIIDVLKYRKEHIRDAIYKCMNLQVGEFIIHINRYNGRPSTPKIHSNGPITRSGIASINASAKPVVATEVVDQPLTLDISVKQEVYKTPSGAPCKMSYKFDFFQDNRFAGCNWISVFDAGGYATNVPIETVVEIIRWMQALRRMNAFL